MVDMDHVRIDEGIKRGRKKAPPNARNAKTQRYLPVLDSDRHQEAIETAYQRIERGECLKTIAQDIGVTHQAVSLWLLDEVPNEYRKAQRRGLIRRIVDADTALDTARDPLALARAREAARFARWDAERRLPHLFGPKQEVAVSISELLSDTLQAIAERRQQLEHTIDTDSTQVLDSDSV